MRAPPQRQIQQISGEREYAEEPTAAGQTRIWAAILRLRLTLAQG
jgi:hypothetical protein